MIEYQVVGRVAAEALARADLEQQMGPEALESERTERLVEQVLASPALERLLADAPGQQTDRRPDRPNSAEPRISPRSLRVLSSPELRAALTDQSTSFAKEIAENLRQRLLRVDDRAERSPRSWLGRPPRPQVAGEPDRVPYAGVATRGLGLIVDAALVTMIFLTGHDPLSSPRWNKL